MTHALSAGGSAAELAEDTITAITLVLPRPRASDAPRRVAESAPVTRAVAEGSVASDRLWKGPSILLGLPLVLVMGVFATAWGGSGNAVPEGIPDPATGKIDGNLALTVVPRELGKRGALPPWGFVAHLTGYDEPDLDLVFPCGVWSQPPRGRYRVWVEGDWQISPFTHVVRYSPQPFRGRGLIVTAVVGEAGRVIVPPEIARDQNLTLRLLHAGSYLEEGHSRWELSRRAKVRDVGGGLLMPVGPTIGALWDEEGQRYVALSRPFEVEARRTVTVPLERPSGFTHLVAQIQRPSLADDAADAAMRVVLRHKGKEVPPDLQVSLTDRAYAVWYELAPGRGVIQAETADGLLRPKELKLVAGKIERLFEIMEATSV